MGFINLGRLNIRKRNSCASGLVSLSDVQPPSVYKSHISNGPINKLYIEVSIKVHVLFSHPVYIDSFQSSDMYYHLTSVKTANYTLQFSTVSDVIENVHCLMINLSCKVNLMF